MSTEEQLRELKIQQLVEGYATRMLEGRDDMLLLSILEFGFPGFRNVEDPTGMNRKPQSLDDWVETLERVEAEEVRNEPRE
jgi:hypothetical protein